MIGERESRGGGREKGDGGWGGVEREDSELKGEMRGEHGM
jgi:hypothetical protein